jgi:hypothetical protein
VNLSGAGSCRCACFRGKERPGWILTKRPLEHRRPGPGEPARSARSLRELRFHVRQARRRTRSPEHHARRGRAGTHALAGHE